jgi:UPF0716 protein FxsA
VTRAAGTLAVVAIAVVLFIVVPIIELYLFIQVSNAIGFLNALGLVVLISLIGLWLVKRAGTRMWARFNEQVVAQREPSKDVADGVCLLGAGLLLVLPGFLTDALGLLLLLPPIRALAARALVRRYSGRSRVRVIKATYGPPGSGTTVVGGTVVGGTVIDTDGVERPPEPPGPSAPPGELDR